MKNSRTTPPSYRFDRSGRWSGGGQVFLQNVEHAEQRHSLLRGAEGAIPIIARNVPPNGKLPSRPFVLAPQNAWPWAPSFNGAAELGRIAGLRVASELFMRMASAVMRISSAIPSINRNSSPVIHNVLDTGFESDLIASQPLTVEDEAVGAFVSVGSINSYRNIVNMINGYRRYRANGGRRRLWIAGSPGSANSRNEIERFASGTEGLIVRWRSLERPECLAALRSAAAVILPSKVEASPVSALEAAACNPNVVVSRIIGHVEVLSEYGRVPEGCLFDPTSPAHLADILAAADVAADSRTGPLADCHAVLIDPAERETARVSWGDRVTDWLQTLNLSAPPVRYGKSVPPRIPEGQQS